ncbi:MAG: Esterase, depolymerase family, partial [Labilithrix sp.]|nr:Esterase, depolymerase family [Labilithrix sp.]
MRTSNILPLTLLGAVLSASSFGGCAPASDAEVAEDVAKTASALGSQPLVEVTGFGANPGALKMFEYAPPSLPASGAPVVVVLHGCSQGATDIARTGWSDLADELGFLVVYPEQVAANNQARCFNWGGVYGDLTNIQRGKDENQSIKEMVDKAITSHGSDPKRIFVAGFSAGGGQAAVIAATWPDVFAGAAIIAGIPYHCNTTFAEAFTCQKPGKDKTPAQWAALVKEAHAGYTGAYPRISIWQGASDTIVGPANRNELVEQWTEVHGVGQTPSATGTVDGASHTVFKDQAGNVVVESYEIPGMDHGVAVVPAQKCG